MLPTNLITALQVLTNPNRQPIEAAKDTPKQAGQFEVGQQLQGTVQAKVSEGLFKVQLAGQTIQMRLPGNIQSGDTLNLRVVSTNPRLTFSISASLNPISTPEQIGSSARMLSSLADRPLERPTIQQIARNIVWQSAGQAPDSKQLAGALRQALSNSGLFYESHQAQWVRGERSTLQLLVEPQNQLTGKSPPVPGQNQASQGKPMDGRPAPPANASPATGAQDKTTGDSGLATVRAPALSALQQTQTGERLAPPANSTPSSAAQAKAAGDSGLPIARELLPLVQQQLHTLETHQITWIGQVWPNQEMHWEIRGQPEHRHQQQDERQWSTEMELTLPRLGNVRARLAFSANGLSLALKAADSATVEIFNRNLPHLKNSLADADVQLIAAAVEKQ
ncbi:MAG: hypothetical protein A2Z65_07130 [Gallionellales bacterium RIFCSPLOWO2_02_58_13]|nr:MAG: hypothetical protein A2Z65_07130 [Gallionellales bacterium RIFCSPLOWO2_02_58_13]